MGRTHTHMHSHTLTHTLTHSHTLTHIPVPGLNLLAFLIPPFFAGGVAFFKEVSKYMVQYNTPFLESFVFCPWVLSFLEIFPFFVLELDSDPLVRAISCCSGCAAQWWCSFVSVKTGKIYQFCYPRPEHHMQGKKYVYLLYQPSNIFKGKSTPVNGVARMISLVSMPGSKKPTMKKTWYVVWV